MPSENLEQVVQQIVELMGQLDPQEAAQVAGKLAEQFSGGGAEEQAEAPQGGVVSPEGGMTGVPVK